jgi:hypothetical protein
LNHLRLSRFVAFFADIERCDKDAQAFVDLWGGQADP